MVAPAIGLLTEERACPLATPDQAFCFKHFQCSPNFTAARTKALAQRALRRQFSIAAKSTYSDKFAQTFKRVVRIVETSDVGFLIHWCVPISHWFNECGTSLFVKLKFYPRRNFMQKTHHRANMLA